MLPLTEVSPLSGKIDRRPHGFEPSMLVRSDLMYSTILQSRPALSLPMNDGITSLYPASCFAFGSIIDSVMYASSTRSLH